MGVCTKSQKDGVDMARKSQVPHTVRAGATKAQKQERWGHLRRPKHHLRKRVFDSTVQDELSQGKDG